MAQNRGKDFEKIVRECFLDVPGVSLDRIHDQTTGFKGSQNICDFIVYKKPYQYYIECKTVHGNTLPFTNITDTQWKGLRLKSEIPGVLAGVMCWWIDKDKTFFLPIQNLLVRKQFGDKSAHIDNICEPPILNWIEVPGKKKRVFFDYDMYAFLARAEVFAHRGEVARKWQNL